MRRMKKLISIVAGLAMAVTATVAAAPQAHAATVCNTAMVFQRGWGVYITQPSYNMSQSCTLRYGNRGDGVWFLQMMLNRCYGSNIAQDGSFGPATRQALINAQRRTGIIADGIYGPQSRNYLKHPASFEVVPVSPNSPYVGCTSMVRTA